MIIDVAHELAQASEGVASENASSPLSA